MFLDIDLDGRKPAYLQIKDYIKEMILKGILQRDVRLPSTRELSEVLKVSRNTIVLAYQYLEDEGFIYTIKGKGAFVSNVEIKYQDEWKVNWEDKLNNYSKMAVELDIVKNEAKWKKGMISFKSIAPDSSLFDVEDFKRAFLNRFSIEGEKILNYGYAKGYKPLNDYLLSYMKSKGVDIENKDILITNGFTEGFDIVISALTNKGDTVLCENPTHNTAIKIMKLHGLNIVGVDMDDDGINIDDLKEKLLQHRAKFAYLIPSYHNPTGIVMSPEKRVEAYRIFREHDVPVIEDGFNEELRYSGAHVSPIISLCGKGNSVIYIGSFSKVLFPGIRIGWILADKKLISIFESIKRSRNIHTSFLDQAILYEYLQGGNFEKYIKKARKVYRNKYEFAIQCAKKYIPYKKLLGEGGLHIFLILNSASGRNVLAECYKRGVIFTPGDIFYVDDGGKKALRLGFARVENKDIDTGFRIIGEVISEMEGSK
jgi:DNA-binding transcriptional MocR family regulator